jgi:hypothetical protein
MRKLSTLLAAAGIAALTVNANAVITAVTVDNGDLFIVASNNAIGGSRLLVNQGNFFNPIALSPGESNLALGDMITNFGPGAPVNTPMTGTYNYLGAGTEPLGFLGVSTPAVFEMFVTDAANPLNSQVKLTVTASLTGETDVSTIIPPFGSRELNLTVLSITGMNTGAVDTFVDGGPSFATTFNNNGADAIGYSFILDGQPFTIKVREVQSPPVFGATGTAIEGRISSVPEPGSVALLMGLGVSGLVALRRRRTR